MREVDKITTSVMSVQLTLNLLESIKHTPYFQKELKRSLNLCLPHLINSEKQYYDNFFEVKEESTTQVYQVYEDFVRLIAGVAIYDMQNISSIIEAYRKDPKSIEGITNKILR